MQIAVLLTPGFLESEAALVLEVARIWAQNDSGIEAFTIAKARNSLQGAGGSVWTPKLTFMSRDPIEILVIPGGQTMAKSGRDPAIQSWLAQTWPNLKQVFLGSNAPVMLAEAGLCPTKVAAHPRAEETLASFGIKLMADSIFEQDKIISTRGQMALVQSLIQALAPTRLRTTLVQSLGIPLD